MESKIKSIEDAFKACGLTLNQVPDVTNVREKDKNYVKDDYNRVIITEALNNEGQEKPWEPDWNDNDQPKYFLVVWPKADEKRPGGFGFASSDYGSSGSNADVGSRHLFRDPALAIYALKQFPDVFKNSFLIVQ